MAKKSAEDNLLDYLKANYGFHASGELQRMRFYNKDGTLASARSLVRRLEENAEGEHAILEVSYGNKGAASYRIKEAHRKTKQVVEYTPTGVKVSYVSA